jgi:hypothetical protein
MEAVISTGSPGAINPESQRCAILSVAVPRFAAVKSEIPEQKNPIRISPVAAAGLLSEKTIDPEAAVILVRAPASRLEFDPDPRKCPTQIPNATALESAKSGLDENPRRDSPGFSAFVGISFMRVNLSEAPRPSSQFSLQVFC